MQSAAGKRCGVGAVVAAVIMLGLSACAGGPPFQPPPMTQGTADIVLFRTSSMVGAANADIVAINDRFAARLTSGTYAIQSVAPGSVEVTRKTGSVLGSGSDAGWGLGGLVGAVDGFRPIASFEVEAGKRYYLRFPHGKRVEENEALALMGGLDRVETGANNKNP